MTFERIILLVLDSVGIGASPDAGKFGDESAHTLGHIAESQGGLHLPVLEKIGLGRIAPLAGVKAVVSPLGSYGKMTEISHGKDTTSGHWELAGCPVFHEFPVYPNGFPDDFIHKLESKIGRRVLGNKPASGTEIIDELGEEHLKTGAPIVYTSADSVLQIAAHEAVISLEELYSICRIAREEVCIGPHEVGRVIARPFVGEVGHFVRTANRHDYSVEPLGTTVLDLLAAHQFEVTGIGKIGDIFVQRGLTASHRTTSNQDGMQKCNEILKKVKQPGLIMANLVDFDSQYGHRRNPAGYKAALEAFDTDLAALLPLITPQDLLMITADHGCDPTAVGSDHTREFVPLLVYSPGAPATSLGIRTSFADVGATIAENFALPPLDYGQSFLSQIVRDPI